MDPAVASTAPPPTPTVSAEAPVAAVAAPNDPALPADANVPKENLETAAPAAARGDGRKGPAQRGGHHGNHQGRQPLAPAVPNPCIMLKNLDYHITQSDLEEVVRNISGGRKGFVNLSLIDDKATGQFRGMAFVNFHSVEDATAALAALSKMIINNRKVIAEFRRLRPGERERREQHERRIRSKFDQAPARTTFESEVSARDADGNALDIRRAFFQKRDDARKAEESKRGVEKDVKEHEKKDAFRKKLEEYRDAPVEPGAEIEDLVLPTNLTSYDRRIVHVLCDEIGLGHVSQLSDAGVRVLHVTKHPERIEEWNAATEDIRKAANEGKDRNKKKAAQQEKKAKNAEAARAADDMRAGAQPVEAEPVTQEELKGLKWFKPRSAREKDGDGADDKNTIRAPQYKLYVPPRQPTGPDGTIGFQRRRPEGADGEGAKEEGADAPAEENADGGKTPGTDSDGTKDDAGAAGEKTASLKSSSSSGMLNPSVAAFTPSAAYAT